MNATQTKREVNIRVVVYSQIFNSALFSTCPLPSSTAKKDSNDNVQRRLFFPTWIDHHYCYHPGFNWCNIPRNGTRRWQLWGRIPDETIRSWSRQNSWHKGNIPRAGYCGCRYRSIVFFFNIFYIRRRNVSKAKKQQIADSPVTNIGLHNPTAWEEQEFKTN